MRRSLPIILLLPLVAVAMVGDERAPDAVASATAFLASLDKDQHRSAVKTFDDDYRTFWRYTPATRQGIAWKDMTADQTAKAVALLKSCLSDLGYQRTQTVREVEAVLGQMENNRGRDRDNYLFTFFGAPSESEVWAWRYEGHHVSLNFTYRGSKLVSSTPQFFGSNPAEVPSGEQKGLRVLAKEEDLGIALLASLTPEQRKAAIVADQAPSEIATAESRVAAIQ